MDKCREAAATATRWLAIAMMLLALPQGLVSGASAQTRAATPATIAAIQVEGNERVDRETVLTYLTVQVGDPFDPKEINASLKELFATGFFATVELLQSQTGNVLIVRVKENPIINRVAFEGNKRLEDDALQAEVQLRARSIYTRAKVQADVQRLIDVYRRSGRFGATVEPKIIRLDQNRVDLVFEIDEGEITSVDRIVFIGNKHFSDSRLRSEILTTETAWWRFYTSADVYDPDRINVDQEQLRRFYLREGYADFRILSAVPELTPERTGFVITFTVDEGERYKFGKINVESKLPEVTAESVLPDLTVEPGDWYDASVVDDDVDIISDRLGERGFAFVDVRPSVKRDRENLLLDVTYSIGEGPRVYVDRININGNIRTQDRVIRREFRLAEGDAYNASKVRRSRERINNLGFFETVDVQTKPGSQPDRLELDVEVVEQSTGEVSFGAGFSTSDGPLADVGIRERNLLGKGQDLRVRLQVSGRRQQIDLGFTEPYFLDRELRAGFDIFRVEEDNTDESSFERDTTGGRLRFGYSFSEYLAQSWSYTLRSDDVRPAVDASQFIKDDAGKSTTSAIAHTLTFDNRDNRFSPNEGYVISTTNEIAGLGGSKRYLRNRVSAGIYYSVAPDYVVSLQGQAGHIIGIGKDVDVNERFNLGGDNFRGFATAGIGPRDLATQDALGGNVFGVGTVEMSFPLPLPNEFALKGRLFAEAGTVFGLDRDNLPGVADDNSIRATVGVGASWDSPFGPIRVDLGLPVVKETYDETQVFHFSFGTRF
jgi:outer membrane protein insertion porin family